ncbi:type VI secretion system Vgr family protein [Niveibacterium umoris]|uniref:Type VI secretion system secreted protein VgrG n=1 Tax=Niveibacterium umoris TaxID=1193620 RepID=A0A840BK68_9RHOO|nr:type VI secretion system Vgr family protein [Niveibacterium umoris]MBB4013655.1 type VI secretion system secreted protein VgrG [Niveibacterium umoris]
MPGPSLSALLSRSFSDANRLLRLTTPLGDDALLVETAHIRESIGNGGFELDLHLLSEDAHIAHKRLVGQAVSLYLLTDGTAGPRERPFHGHVTGFGILGADGGFARYRMRVQPWLAFLGHNRDSWAFQDKNVVAILDDIFSGWQGQGALAPQWRWDLAEPDQLLPRSLCVQAGESDLAFVERLLAEEGLFYWFEHAADAHTLVIADHNGAFAQPERIRFHRAAATERSDTVQRAVPIARCVPTGVRIASWDYRAHQRIVAQTAVASSAPLDLPRDDTPGLYSFATESDGDRYATRQLQAWQARALQYRLRGSVRRLAPAQRILLTDSPLGRPDDVAGVELAILEVEHRARNNLSADVLAQVEALLGVLPAHAGSVRNDSDTPLYQNGVLAIPADTPYRPLDRDEHGARIHPKPTMRGTHTAIVVGSQGSPLLADRDGRIKIQLPWLRGSQSHSRQPHPSGDDNAAANESVGTWVRVASALAGDNWGAHFTPRIGQEVLVEFSEGDIDRPVVVGLAYNGRGQENAQGNAVSAGAAKATGNAPAWFPGTTGAHAHKPVFSGIKTQALAASQSRAGGHNALIFDATPGQDGLRLSTTQFDSRLQLGHLRAQTDNAREAARGHGAELATSAAGAVRAGQGLQVSAGEAGHRGASHVDASGASAVLESSSELATALAKAASTSRAKLPKDPSEPKQLPPLAGCTSQTKDLAETTACGQSPAGIAGGTGTAAAWAAPHLSLFGEASIAFATPAHSTAVANHLIVTAGQSLEAAAQGAIRWASGGGLVLYTVGKKADATRPITDAGIKLHAVAGKVTAHAHDNTATVAAQKQVALSSTHASVQISAKSHVHLTAAGAAIQIEGGNITLTAPGSVKLKASQKNLTGGARASSELPCMPKSNGEEGDRYFVLKSHKGEPIANRRYRAKSGNVAIEGVTGPNGETKILEGFIDQIARFELVNEVFDEHFILTDPIGQPIANMTYRIRAEGGALIDGVTDDQGRTSLYKNDAIESVELLFIPHEHSNGEGGD